MQVLSEEKRELAAIAVKQATKLSKRWEKLNPRYADELRSASHLAAIRAADTYDESRGESWDRWIALCVKSEAMGFLKTPYASDNNDYDSILEDSIIDDTDYTSEVDDYDMLRSLISRLTKRQRDICELVYLKGMTPHGAGETLGIRPDNACRLHRWAIERLREMAAA